VSFPEPLTAALIAAAVLGLIVAAVFVLLKIVGRPASGGALGGARYLCDSCRYDYGDACRRPERPNASECPEYRKS